MVDLKDLYTSGFTFKKGLGQNFITDMNLLHAICSDADISEGDLVVEVGVGAGTLTQCLAARAKKVFGFEIDKRLEAVIEESLAGVNNASIIYRDVMDVSMREIELLCKERFKLVANLPYYITTPVIMKFVEESEQVDSITVMVQEEVAKRLCADAGEPEYGGISAVIRYAGTPKLLRKVSRRVFTPVPNVDSAIIRIDLYRNRNYSEFVNFRKTVRAAFAMRRKTLANNLSAAFLIEKSEAIALLVDCGYSEKVRGEEIDCEGFKNLSSKLFSLLLKEK